MIQATGPPGRLDTFDSQSYWGSAAGSEGPLSFTVADRPVRGNYGMRQANGSGVAVYLVLIGAKTVLKATESKREAEIYRDVYSQFHSEEAPPKVRRRMVDV